MLNESDVRERLSMLIHESGGQRQFAERHGFSAVYVHDVLHGRRGFSDRMLKAMKLERVVQYRNIAHDIAHDIAHTMTPGVEKKEEIPH